MAEGGRTWRTWQLAVTAAVFLTLGIGMGASSSPKDETVATTGQADQSVATEAPAATAPPPTPAPTVATTTTAPGPKTEFGAGTYRVGVDISPGTYVAPGGSPCYWERQSVFGGGPDSIIANDISRGGQAVVTIAASDKGFKTSGCGTWKRS